MPIMCYNGGTDSYHDCSNPSNLVIGKIYDVIGEIVSQYQTNYILEGITGEFNSV